ncbi:hypothetical protein MKK69_00230, partial [Methylobacterium sp. J-026]|uniref:hypothetical protein n=1 Tax=Methylobacterium sp. J-026 TaxID=2836624 RepID=UPI001FBA761C
MMGLNTRWRAYSVAGWRIASVSSRQQPRAKVTGCCNQTTAEMLRRLAVYIAMYFDRTTHVHG